MTALFACLMFLSLIGLVVGLIKPRWIFLPSRKWVAFVCGGAVIVFLVLIGFTAPPVDHTTAEASTVLGTQTTSSTPIVATTTDSTEPTPAVVSNTTVSIGNRTKTSNCVGNQTLPDTACSPGAVLTTDPSVICVSGYTKTVRNVPTSEKEQVFAEYGIPYSEHSNYEVDHIISLELGGSNDIANLYPESYSIQYNARIKDTFENHLHTLICNGTLSVQTAQQEIATDWLKYYLLWKGGTAPTSTATPAAPVAATQTTSQSSSVQVDTTGPETKKSTSDICHERGTTYYDRTIHYTAYDSLQTCLDSGGRLPK